MKNYNDTIGNRIRDLPACSTVLQIQHTHTHTHTQNSKLLYKNIIFKCDVRLLGGYLHFRKKNCHIYLQDVTAVWTPPESNGPLAITPTALRVTPAKLNPHNNTKSEFHDVDHDDYQMLVNIYFRKTLNILTRKYAHTSPNPRHHACIISIIYNNYLLNSR